MRLRREGRAELRRSIEEIETPFGRLRVKTAVLPSGEERRVPEYDDLRRIARDRGRPLIEIMDEIRAFLRDGERATP